MSIQLQKLLTDFIKDKIILELLSSNRASIDCSNSHPENKISKATTLDGFLNDITFYGANELILYYQEYKKQPQILESENEEWIRRSAHYEHFDKILFEMISTVRYEMEFDTSFHDFVEKTFYPEYEKTFSC
jgi:hypothetical protein